MLSNERRPGWASVVINYGVSTMPCATSQKDFIPVASIVSAWTFAVKEKGVSHRNTGIWRSLRLPVAHRIRQLRTQEERTQEERVQEEMPLKEN